MLVHNRRLLCASDAISVRSITATMGDSSAMTKRVQDSLSEIFTVVGSEDKYCDRHRIEYTANTYRVGPHLHTNGCPMCKAEQDRRDEVERLKRFEEERKANILAATLSKIPVPPRFENSCFANYMLDQDADTQQQGRRLAQLQAYADGFPEHYSKGTSLILIGRTGTGKTHLALAAAKQIAINGFQARYLTARKLFRQIRSTWNKRSELTEQQMIDQLADTDLLIIDEIGAQRGTDDELNTMFEIVDERYQRNRPSILISNLPWPELKEVIGERSADRLRDSGGKMLTFEWESHRAPAS